MKILAVISFLLVITSPPALAMQVQPNKLGLLASCQALAQKPALTGSSNSACHYYIQGVLANSYFNESVNVASLNQSNTQPLSFVQRAYNTRVGNRGNDKRPLYSNYFCLPEDEPLTQVFKVLSKPMSSKIETTKDLNAIIFHALKAQYPCS